MIPAALMVLSLALEAAEVAAPRGLVMGRDHICVLDGGRTTCWGSNGDFQLGDGFTGFSSVPIAGPATVEFFRAGSGFNRDPVVQVLAARESTCVRSAGGRVACWGEGDARTANVDGLDDAVDLVTASGDVCALRKNGHVACWDQSSYETGLGRRIRPKAVAGVSGLVTLLGPERGRRRDGRVVHWKLHPCVRKPGRACAPDVVVPESFDAPVPPPRPPAVAVFGDAHRCTLLADGRVRCRSHYNAHGQVGDGTMAEGPREGDVLGLADAVEIAAAGDHTCARRRSGAVVCWGANPAGQVGAAAQRDQPAPVAVKGIDDASGLVLGVAHSCALRRLGGFACWGRGAEGQLGDATLMHALPATPVRVAGVVRALEIAAGASHTCARDASGSLRCWGRPRPAGPGDCVPTPAGIVCPSLSGGGGTSCGRSWSSIETYAVPERIADLVSVIAHDARSNRTCAVAARGRIVCFGEKDSCCGDKTLAFDEVAAVPDAVEVALGGGHACVRTRVGRIACWGKNSDGQLGDGSRVDRAGPVAVKGVEDAAMLALGERHTCALLRDGRVACFGFNATGQLGAGHARPVEQAVNVAGVRDAVEIRAGYWHTCARTRAGEVLCWGENDHGAIGDATTADRPSPAKVEGLPPAASLAAFGHGTCARDHAGVVFCWGEVSELPDQPRPVRRFRVE